MGRPGHVWLRSSRGRWYAKIGGRMVDLGTDREQAERRREELLNGPAVATSGTVTDLVGKYVAAVKHRLKRKTAGDLANRLAWLSREFGHLTPAQLDPLEVERRAGRESWRRGTVRQTLAAVQQFARWAGVERFRVRIPPAEYRGHECLVTPAEFARLMTVASGDFRALLVVLWETGARPGEVRKLTAEQVDWGKGLAILRDHKTAKTGKLRTLIFPPAAMVVLAEQRAKYCTGHLFRGGTGFVLSMPGVNARWRAARVAAGVSAPTCYALRHAYITDRLEAGVPAARVAAMVGTSLVMIERTYSHVGANIDGLRAVAGRTG